MVAVRCCGAQRWPARSHSAAPLLTWQVDKRLAAVKRGMAGLHERLQSVEGAMARLPDHLSKLSRRIKDQVPRVTVFSLLLSCCRSVPNFPHVASTFLGRRRRTRDETLRSPI